MNEKRENAINRIKDVILALNITESEKIEILDAIVDLLKTYVSEK